MSLPLRLAFRQLVRSPGFSAVAILTLALGIGAATLLFSVLDGVLIEPLPYRDADRIVRVFEVDANGRLSRPADPNFADMRAQSRVFESFAQYGGDEQPAIAAGGEGARVDVAVVSREFFDVLDVAPTLGRGFVAEELEPGAAPAALVSYGYWQRYLGGRPGLTDQTVTIGNTTYTIVGVLPRGFAFPDATDIWTPAELFTAGFTPSRTAHNFDAIGRLAQDVTLTQARDELGAIARRIEAEHGGDVTLVDAAVVPLLDTVVGSVRPALLVLAAAGALLFVVACANVVSMLLARAVGREHELRIRAALGAGRARIATQFFAEALVLCAAATVLGVLLAAWGGDALVVLAAGRLPRVDAIGVDWPTLGFAAALAIATAAGLSLVVARQAAAVGMPSADHGRSVAGARRSRLRDGLMAAQVALALVLLIGAVLLGRSFVRLMGVDPGFRLDDIVYMDVSGAWPQLGDDPSPLALRDEALMDSLRSVPGVESVGGSSLPPLAGSGWNGLFVELEYPDEIHSFADFGVLAADRARTMWAEYRIASEDYFATLGIPLLRGRLFEHADGPGAEHVAVVSRALAESRWPGQDPIGKLVEFGNMDGDLTPMRVVGVVGDTRELGLDQALRPTFYGYYRQRTGRIDLFSIAIRTANPAAVVPAAREIARRMSPNLVPTFTRSEDLFAASIAGRRLNLVLLGIFGGAALVLALTGVYGAIAFNVAQRTREIGVRMALGALRRTVVTLVLGRSLALAGAGIGVGVLVALGASAPIETLLYGVPARDATSYLASAGLIFVAAAAAASVPAMRAARVDPMRALREE